MSTSNTSRSQSLIRSKRELGMENLVAFFGNAFLMTVAAVSVFIILAIFFFIIRESLPFINSGHLKELFTSTAWKPNHQVFGGLSLFYGSAIVTLGAAVVAIPTGVLAAVALSDILSFNTRQFVKPIIELLASIPSVAYGFFALVIFTPWLQSLGVKAGSNALNVSIILGIMALPTVVSVLEDSLQAIGPQLREASYGLGATRAETLLRVILPASTSGIAAASILGIMRAVGETMVVWMAAGGATNIPEPWYNILAPVRTLTATIAGEMGDADQTANSLRYSVLFTLALCLLIISLVCNLLGQWAVRRQTRLLRGE